MKILNNIDTQNWLPANDFDTTLPFTSRAISEIGAGERIWLLYQGERAEKCSLIERWKDENNIPDDQLYICIDDETQGDIHKDREKPSDDILAAEVSRLETSVRKARCIFPNAKIGFWNIPSRLETVDGRMDATLDFVDFIAASHYDYSRGVSDYTTFRKWLHDSVQLARPRNVEVIAYVSDRQSTDGVVTPVPPWEFAEILRACRDEDVDGVAMWARVDYASDPARKPKWGYYDSMEHADQHLSTLVYLMRGVMG